MQAILLFSIRNGTYIQHQQNELNAILEAAIFVHR